MYAHEAINHVANCASNVELWGVTDVFQLLHISLNWGDEDPKSEQTLWFPASHTYAQNGTYRVRVTGLTNDGKRIVLTKSVTIP